MGKPPDHYEELKPGYVGCGECSHNRGGDCEKHNFGLASGYWRCDDFDVTHWGRGNPRPPVASRAIRHEE